MNKIRTFDELAKHAGHRISISLYSTIDGPETCCALWCWNCKINLIERFKRDKEPRQ